MPDYLHPGVYIEEFSSGARPIEGVASAITAFIGKANSGPTANGKEENPYRIAKFQDYIDEFGAVTNPDDAMGMAVQAFYMNGGGAAYICRLEGDDAKTASLPINNEGNKKRILNIKAKSKGKWGNNLRIQVIKSDPYSLTFTLRFSHMELTDYGSEKLVEDEFFSDLSMVKDSNQYVINIIKNRSRIIKIEEDFLNNLNDNTSKDKTPYNNASISGAYLKDIVSDLTSYITDKNKPRALRLKINELGFSDYPINLDNITDSASVVNAIQAAIREKAQLGGTYNACSGVTVEYTKKRLTIRTSEGINDAFKSANHLIQVDDDFGLAKTLGLDSGRYAEITGSEISATAPPPDIPADKKLTITLDGIEKEVEVDFAEVKKVERKSGSKIAQTIQSYVRNIAPNIPSYSEFKCRFSENAIVMSSGCSSCPESDVSLSGELATALGFENAASIPGRMLKQGTRNVIPQQTSDLNRGESLSGGESATPDTNVFRSFYDKTLYKYRDISIVVLPGNSWDDKIAFSKDIIGATKAHCEKMQNRLLIIDPPESNLFRDKMAVEQLGLPASKYTALYYPWVKVRNPAYHPDTNPNADKTISIAPSAFAAGMWAKTDGRRGVWKAPAGVETQLTGDNALEYHIEDTDQDPLNQLGINCIRSLPSYGNVFWGARTLATKVDPEWRYIPVRRTAIYIEESIYQNIHWAVFEPNDEPLWMSLRASISAFMDTLFRAGAFQGHTAKDAYFVHCGLGATMTQADIEAGKVIVVVGFAPLKPAEFVIVRIQQIVGGSSEG